MTCYLFVLIIDSKYLVNCKEKVLQFIYSKLFTNYLAAIVMSGAYKIAS